MISEIIQIVPPEWCSECDVCCRFPESTSYLAPYFTAQEITMALESGANAPDFPHKTGCRITLAPHEEGYICPVFIPVTAQCRIYSVRPFDCVLYPFALMRDVLGKEVVLGLDTKCPYVRAYAGADFIRGAAADIAHLIESPPLIDMLSEHHDLIGPFQDDVIPLTILESLSSRIK